MPLPSKQVYEPVRVCTTCYSSLQPDSSDNSSAANTVFNARRSGPIVNAYSHHSSNGHSMDMPADMAESALSTFTQHHHAANGNSCGFSYVAVASDSAHSDQRDGMSLSDGKMGTQQGPPQPRKATAAYV